MTEASQATPPSYPALAAGSAAYPVVDFFDYPLPGRAFYLTLVYQP